MPKFCYCIIDRDSSQYLDMAALSVAFLRQTQPSCHVEIFTDVATWERAQSEKHPLLGTCDEWIKVDCAVWSAVDASRYLKTSLRQLAHGDYVFLDADIVPIAPWAPQLRPTTSLSLALDVWCVENSAAPPSTLVREYESMGWTLPLLYYNSGIMFMKDNEFNRSLSQQWFERWHLYTARIGKHLDQPALNATFEAVPGFAERFEILPMRFNALITGVHRALKNAAFLHFLSDEDKTVHLGLVARQREGRLSNAEIQEFAHHPYPWKNLGQVSAHWHARQYSLAGLAALSKVLKRKLY